MSKYFIILAADNMDVLKDNVTRKMLNHVKIKKFKSNASLHLTLQLAAEVLRLKPLTIR